MKKEINEVKIKIIYIYFVGGVFFFFSMKHKIAMVTAMIIELKDFASNVFRRKPMHNFKGMRISIQSG